MKTMTCAQLGGPCEEQISGNTPEELLAHAMGHLEATHPEMAADVKTSMASPEDPKMVEWNNKFKEDWEKTPEN